MADRLVTESARERARATWSDWASSPIGWAELSGVGVLAGVLAYFTAPDSLSDTVKGVVILVFAAAVVLAFGAGVFWCLFVLAPKWQRDEARRRLRDMKEAKDSYSIVPGEPFALPLERVRDLYIPIRNEGRGGRFSIMLEGFDGLDEELRHPNARLYWSDRYDVDVEEIPPGDGRNIGVGELIPTVGGTRWRFRPFSPTGRRDENKSYLLPEDGTATFWVRISARDDPDVAYARRTGLGITLDPFGEWKLKLIEPEDGEVTHSFPKLESLFEYEV